MSNKTYPMPPSALNDPTDARGPGHMIVMPDTLPMRVLTVSDIERLAKAGVKVEFENIREQIVPDPPPARDNMFDCSKLLRPLIARLRQAHMNRERYIDMSPFQLGTVPYFLSAACYGDKVYVFVAPQGSAPVILEDEVNLYPSDALMAKLYLMDQFHKEKT